jgi:ubiquinone/menaquinone biosynthesis C-methylase UbiE
MLADDLGTVLELGAGTGLFTLGMLTQSGFDHAVVTDISPAMLRLCAARIDHHLGDRRHDVTLATYSGAEDIFASGQYDLCIANSVLHHILDYGAVLKTARTALKDSGLAAFVEPGAPCHEAMTLAMSDAIVSMLADGAWRQDLDIVAAWTAQTRFCLRATPAELTQFEDKHIFTRSGFEASAQAAGFSETLILPFNHDPLAYFSVRNYLAELGAPDDAANAFMPVYKRHAEHHFRAVGREDMSEMYIIVLRP